MFVNLPYGSEDMKNSMDYSTHHIKYTIETDKQPPLFPAQLHLQKTRKFLRPYSTYKAYKH
jgi:hypothetical protein